MGEGVFGDDDYEFVIRFWKFLEFEMVDIIWWLKNVLLHILMKYWITGLGLSLETK